MPRQSISTTITIKIIEAGQVDLHNDIISLEALQALVDQYSEKYWLEDGWLMTTVTCEINIGSETT